MKIDGPLTLSIHDSIMIGPTLLTTTTVFLLAAATACTRASFVEIMNIVDGFSYIYHDVRHCAMLRGCCGPPRYLGIKWICTHQPHLHVIYKNRLTFDSNIVFAAVSSDEYKCDIFSRRCSFRAVRVSVAQRRSNCRPIGLRAIRDGTLRLDGDSIKYPMVSNDWMRTSIKYGKSQVLYRVLAFLLYIQDQSTDPLPHP